MQYSASQRRLFKWHTSLLMNALVSTLSLFDVLYFFLISDRVIVALDLTVWGPLVTRLGQLSIISTLASAFGTSISVCMTNDGILRRLMEPVAQDGEDSRVRRRRPELPGGRLRLACVAYAWSTGFGCIAMIVAFAETITVTSSLPTEPPSNRIGVWMISYGQLSGMRSLIDGFQRRQSCCGNIDVRGWYDIPTWSTDEEVRRGLEVGFPESCCNTDTEQQANSANRTCQNIMPAENTNELSPTFENGCFMALVELYRTTLDFGSIVFGCLVCGYAFNVYNAIVLITPPVKKPKLPAADVDDEHRSLKRRRARRHNSANSTTTWKTPKTDSPRSEKSKGGRSTSTHAESQTKTGSSRDRTESTGDTATTKKDNLVLKQKKDDKSNSSTGDTTTKRKDKHVSKQRKEASVDDKSNSSTGDTTTTKKDKYVLKKKKKTSDDKSNSSTGDMSTTKKDKHVSKQRKEASVDDKSNSSTGDTTTTKKDKYVLKKKKKTSDDKSNSSTGDMSTTKKDKHVSKQRKEASVDDKSNSSTGDMSTTKKDKHVLKKKKKTSDDKSNSSTGDMSTTKKDKHVSKQRKEASVDDKSNSSTGDMSTTKNGKSSRQQGQGLQGSDNKTNSGRTDDTTKNSWENKRQRPTPTSEQSETDGLTAGQYFKRALHPRAGH